MDKYNINELKHMGNYYIPWYYYRELKDWKIEVVWVAEDCVYLAQYGNQDSDIWQALNSLNEVWLNISLSDIWGKYEDEDFYPLINPIILDKVILIEDEENEYIDSF